MSVYAVGDEPGGMYGLVDGGLGISIAPGERGPYTAHFAMPGTWFGNRRRLRVNPVGSVSPPHDRPSCLHLPLHAMDEVVAREPAAWRYFGL